MTSKHKNMLLPEFFLLVFIEKELQHTFIHIFPYLVV